MKKTVFHKIRRLFRFTLLVCLSLGILSAKAQTARVTLKVQNASLGQVMDEIKNQTRYLFINQDVKDLNNHKVSLNVSDKAIAEVLDQIFTPFNIGYRIEKTSIIIFNRPKSTSNSVLIGGKVSDVGGAPIIGAGQRYDEWCFNRCRRSFYANDRFTCHCTARNKLLGLRTSNFSCRQPHLF